MSLFDERYLTSSVPPRDLAGLSAVTFYIDELAAGPAESDAPAMLSFRQAAQGAEVHVVLRSGSRGDAHMAYAECVIDGSVVWGAGRGSDIIAAAGAAIGSAFARSGACAASEEPAG